MTSDHHQAEQIQQTRQVQGSPTHRWQVFLHAYTRVNQLSHHVLGACIKFFVVLCLLFGVLFMVLRYAVLPHIGNYKPEIEHMLGSALARSVSIAHISAIWRGLRPGLDLQQVVIRDEQGQNVLVLPSAQMTLSWLSFLVAEVRLYNLEISQPELTLKRSADGKIYIAGWWLDPTKKNDASGINWLLSQHTIVIKNGTVHWVDQQRGAPVLTLSKMDFVMQNRWQHHQFSLTAHPPPYLAGPLDVRADFKHHPLSENISDVLDWEGQLFVDLSNTDLAGWGSYVDYPFPIQQGVGNVRAWLTFDQAQIVDFTADIKLSDVKTWLRQDLPPIDLRHIAGRISAQEIIIPSNANEVSLSIADRFRNNGHQINLTNFTFETHSGKRLPMTTLSERFTPANKNNAEQFQFSTKFLDLSLFAKLIEHFPLPHEYIEILKKLEPAGQLFNFSARFQGKLPELSHYQISGQFANLAIKPQVVSQIKASTESSFFALFSSTFSVMPGFTNLTGQIDVNEKKGSIQLASTNLSLQLPGFFPDSQVKLDAVDMKANWLFQKDNHLLFTLTNLDVKQKNMQAHVVGTHLIPTYPITHGETKLESRSDKTKSTGILHGMLDLSGTISHLDLKKITHYLPTGTDPDLFHWLTQGLQQGSMDDVHVRIKGKLADFPFDQQKLLDQNIFYVTGKITDGKIDYLPGSFAKDGVRPYWPILSKIQGQIIFDRGSMDIHAKSGETAGIPVANVHARIPDLLNKNPLLEIDGEASAPAQDILHYLSVSPVLEWIDNFVQDTRITGDAKLKLRLNIPLSHPLDTKVAGQVQLNDNDVALIKELPLFTQVNGRLDFNEQGLNLKALKAGFLGGGVTVSGGTQQDGIIRIKAEGQAGADGLRKAYPQPELKQILTRIDGKATYTAIIQIRNKRMEVWLDSTLQGMALHLPAPLNKTASDDLHLHFELTDTSSHSAKETGKETPERDEVKLSLGSVFNVHYLRQKQSGTSSWKVKSGGIGVNAPAPKPVSGLSVHLELASFNVDELHAFIPQPGTLLANKPENKLINNEITPPVDHLVFNRDLLYQYLEPDLLSVRAAELILMGKKINQVILGASRLNGIWQANIDSKQISGYLVWDDSDQSLGHVTAHLSSLIIAETSANDVVDLLQNKHIHSTIPGLDVVVENVELFGKKLGRLELRAKNVNPQDERAANQWQIDTLSLTNPDAELTAQGKWINGGSNSVSEEDNSNNSRANPEQNDLNQSQTNLKYKLVLTNAGKLLDRLGYVNVISGGKGKLIGEISWNGSPYSMNIPSLSGAIQLDLHAGRFLKADAGAAKLLTVLNLQALPRRLMLDFRDVFSEGFSFDEITGDAQIKMGVAETDNLKMNGMTATVLLNGTANMAKETQDLHVLVIPEVNAGAASVVYGLIVNPVIGAGTFLAQLFLRDPLMKAFTFEYQITGPWKEPNVEKLK